MWKREGNNRPEGHAAGGGVWKGTGGQTCPAEGAASQRSDPALLLTHEEHWTGSNKTPRDWMGDRISCLEIL